MPLTRNGGTVLIYGVSRPTERLSLSPYEIFRREITIKGTYSEMSSFDAAIAALRKRVRTKGIIAHRSASTSFGTAIQTLEDDPTVPKVILVISKPN